MSLFLWMSYAHQKTTFSVTNSTCIMPICWFFEKYLVAIFSVRILPSRFTHKIVCFAWNIKTTIISPLFEQTFIYFTQGCFVPKLVEIGSVVLEKIFKFRQFIFTLLLLSPLEKGRGPLFEGTWIPFTQGWFVPSLV